MALSLILCAKELNEYWVLYNTTATAQGFSVQLTVPTRIKSLSLSKRVF